MTAQTRLREFISMHQPGGCKILSQGELCECALCDFDRIVKELHWYGDYAEAIARDFDKHTDALLASIIVLKLDAGKRSKI